MANMHLVPSQPEAWGIYGPKIDVPKLFSEPEEAVAHLVMTPADWPEDVDFWINLTRRGGLSWPALGVQHKDLKRPTFHNVGLIRTVAKDGIIEWTSVDFWFLIRFMEALEGTGYRHVICSDHAETKDASIFSGLRFRYEQLLKVRQRSAWATDFLLVESVRALNFFGIVPVEKPSPRKGWVERVSHRLDCPRGGQWSL